MTQFVNTAVFEGWKNLLQEIVLAKHYLYPYLLDNAAAIKNPILEVLLPSLLYVKMVSLFDEALEHYITDKGLTQPKQYRNDLNGRIDFLDSQSALQDPAKLHETRRKRNDLAHEVGKTVTWRELDDGLGIIERELQKLGLVGDRPQYEYYGERSKVRDSTNPKAFAAVDYYFGLKCKGQKVIEFSSTREFLRSSE